MNKFVFPKALLNQIGECSKGYFLVVINQDNEFEIYEPDKSDPLTKMGMINFLEVYSMSQQAQLRDKSIESLGLDEGDGEDSGDEGCDG